METISQPKEVKARKEHRCNFCGDKIRINQKYTKSTHVGDGSVYNWKTHNHCDRLAHELKLYQDVNIHEGVGMDDFVEVVSEKHRRILCELIPGNIRNDFSDVINQFDKVGFTDKLWFVIRHINKTKGVKLHED